MKTLVLDDSEVGHIITVLAMHDVPLIAKISQQCTQQQGNNNAGAQTYPLGDHAKTGEDVAAHPRFDGGPRPFNGPGNSGGERSSAASFWPGQTGQEKG